MPATSLTKATAETPTNGWMLKTLRTSARARNASKSRDASNIKEAKHQGGQQQQDARNTIHV